MQGLPSLPPAPDIRFLRGRKSRPLLLAHKHTILKPQVYQMVLHRPVECTRVTGQVVSGGFHISGSEVS
jgi:hypothetical protein